MKRVMFIFIAVVFFSTSFAWVIGDFEDPSPFSRAIGGAVYPLYEGAQSIGYNPAGIANGNGEVYFSHTEHFLGVVRNEFLSASLQLGSFAFGSAIQYTYPTDMFYYQYKFIVSTAYRFGENSIGLEVNKWKGSEIENGQSLDVGAIMNFSTLNLSMVVKNLLASIDWASTRENYSPEVILSTAYFSKSYTMSGYVNLNAKIMGMGVIWPLTNFLDVMGGIKADYGVELSGELSTGLRVSYNNFIMDVCYSFKEPLKFGDSLSPFYISLTYDVMKGM